MFFVLSIIMFVLKSISNKVKLIFNHFLQHHLNSVQNLKNIRAFIKTC